MTARPAPAPDRAARASAPAGATPASDAQSSTAQSSSGQSSTGQSSTGHGGADFGFAVALDNFEGPFDLLLTLIGRHKLDVTEIALAKVTDDFIAFLRRDGGELDLDTASQFLVVAATLLDLKAARLLPSGDVEDDEDIALLEARDLLFARLLQYRAYKEVAAIFADRIAIESRRHPRTTGPDERFVGLLPEVFLGLGPEEFARLAARALAPRPAPPGVGLAHLHVPQVSVREQATLLSGRLQRLGQATFRALIADCDSTVLVVGRFLALLDLYRDGVVSFEQVTPLGELNLRWTGPPLGADAAAHPGGDEPAPRDDAPDADVIDIRRSVRPDAQRNGPLS